MPTYEYECEKCRRTFEVEQKISDPPLTECRHTYADVSVDGFAADGKECDGRLRRLIAGRTGFVLNGKGWFKDGY